MKKFILSFIIFFLAFSVLFPQGNVSAQAIPPPPPAPPGQGGNITLTPEQASFYGASAPAVTSPSTQPANTNAPPSGAPLSASEMCGWYDVMCAFRNAIMWLSLSILYLFAWLLTLAGGVLNIAINWFVIGFGDLILKGGFGGAISELWTLIRDLVNITFVFGLVYIGISTIIGSSSETKKMLSGIIVSALLVNFSLYFAKAIIDISNLTADTIYKGIITTPAGGGQLRDENTGLSGAFVARLGLTDLFVGSKKQELNNSTLNKLQKWTNDSWETLPKVVLFCLGVSIIFFKLTFAFAFAAALLLIRFVMLIMVMIFAPIAFLPAFLPGVGEMRQQWWTTLLSQAFLAPVFLFGIYITLKVLSFTTVSGSQMEALFDTGGVGAMGALVYFVITVIMIIMSVAIAKSMADKGAGHTIHAAQYAGKMVGAAIAGGGMVLRGSAVVANAGANNRLWSLDKGLSNAAANLGHRSSFFGKPLGKAAAWGINGVRRRGGAIRNSSFDARNAGPTGMVTGMLGLDVGKGSDRNAKKYSDERKKHKEEHNAEHNAEFLAYERGIAVKAWLAKPNDAALRKAAQDKVRDMSNTELEKESVDTLKKIAGLLSDKQTDHIKDHKDKYDLGQKNAIKTSRKSAQTKFYGDGGPVTATNPLGLTGVGAADFFAGKKGEEVSKLPKEIILHSAAIPHLSGEMLKKIQNSEAINDSEAVRLKSDIETLYNNTPAANRTHAMESAMKYFGTAASVSFYG